MYRIKALGSKLRKDWIIVLNTGKFSVSPTLVCNPTCHGKMLHPKWGSIKHQYRS